MYRIESEYFEYMYNIVCNDLYSELTYRDLLTYLNNIEFFSIIECDSNRIADGIDLRYRFGYDRNYDNDTIGLYLDNRPCSVLEMLVALAFRIEEEIMDDSSYGDRTGQWFWGMIVNLGLGNMYDGNFDIDYCEDIIIKFLHRQYEPNGEGGLCTLKDSNIDMREVEIWYQMMWYLDDFL